MSAKQIDKKRQAYQAVFNNPNGEEVLKDLAQFCCVYKASPDLSHETLAKKEGLRAVWLRIQNYLNISDDDVWHLFKREETDINE